MNQKIDITKEVLSKSGMDISDLTIKKVMPVWWRNPRVKKSGGLGLTEAGFSAFADAGLPNYKIVHDDYIFYNNKLIIGLDHHINSPFYICKDEIYVFNEQMAVQLILFAGNIEKFVTAKLKSLERS